jgi:hypothetical protein
VYDTWEHALDILPENYFDAILFDPYPLDEAASNLKSWPEKFRFVATRAAPALSRVLARSGRLGFLNFEPSVCDSEFIERAFLALFSVGAPRKTFQSGKTSRLGEDCDTHGATRVPEAWVLERIAT